MDTLIVMVHSVTMPVRFRRDGIKQKGRPLANMVQLKGSIVEVGAEEKCLEHALMFAIARLNNEPNTHFTGRTVIYIPWFTDYSRRQVSI